MTLVERIKSKVKEKNISIKAYEKEIGLGNGTISKWETQAARIDKLTMVANNLHVSLDWLVYGKEENELMPEERELLEAYRAAELEDKNAARKQLDLPKLMQSSEFSGKSFGYETGKEAI